MNRCRKEEAIVIDLIRKYDLALQMEAVNDPVAWALYHTWEEADADRAKREKERREYRAKA